MAKGKMRRVSWALKNSLTDNKVEVDPSCGGIVIVLGMRGLLEKR